MQFYPSSKAQQVAQILIKQIEAGKFSKRLPGERKLSQELLVSRNCIREALEELTHLGYLEESKPSKQRLILVPSQTSGSPKKIIFFTPEPEHRAPASVLIQVARLRNFLSDASIPVEILSSRVFEHTKASTETLKRMLEENPASHWILHQCPEHIQAIFSRQSVAVTVLGSVFNGIKLPSMDVDFKSVSQHATSHLLAKGHRRIALLRFRSQLAGDEQAVDGIRCALQDYPDTPSPRILSHNFHVDRLCNVLDGLLDSRTSPTALIVVNVHHYLTVHSHLLSKGLSIPQDISVLCLSHDPSLDRLKPTPFCYRLGDALIQNLSKQLLSESTGISRTPKLLIPTPDYGETVSAV